MRFAARGSLYNERLLDDIGLEAQDPTTCSYSLQLVTGDSSTRYFVSVTGLITSRQSQHQLTNQSLHACTVPQQRNSINQRVCAQRLYRLDKVHKPYINQLCVGTKYNDLANSNILKKNLV